MEFKTREKRCQILRFREIFMKARRVILKAKENVIIIKSEKAGLRDSLFILKIFPVGYSHERYGR